MLCNETLRAYLAGIANFEETRASIEDCARQSALSAREVRCSLPMGASAHVVRLWMNARKLPHDQGDRFRNVARSSSRRGRLWNEMWLHQHTQPILRVQC